MKELTLNSVSSSTPKVSSKRHFQASQSCGLRSTSISLMALSRAPVLQLSSPSSRVWISVMACLDSLILPSQSMSVDSLGWRATRTDVLNQNKTKQKKTSRVCTDPFKTLGPGFTTQEFPLKFNKDTFKSHLKQHHTCNMTTYQTNSIYFLQESAEESLENRIACRLL